MTFVILTGWPFMFIQNCWDLHKRMLWLCYHFSNGYGSFLVSDWLTMSMLSRVLGPEIPPCADFINLWSLIQKASSQDNQQNAQWIELCDMILMIKYPFTTCKPKFTR